MDRKRLRTEDAHPTSEECYRSLVESAAEHIFMLDTEGRYLSSNHATVRERLARGETCHVCDLHSEAVSGPYMERVRQVIATVEPVTFEHEAEESDGLHIHLDTLYPIRREGAVWAVGGMCRDITERKEAEEALRASEERYQRLTHAVTDYIYTVMLGNDGRVAETVHGHGCEAVTGYRPEEFTAQPYLWIAMVLPEDREAVKAYAQRLLAGEQVAPYEHRIVRKDGQGRWVRNTPSLRKDASGRLLSYDGLVSDITQRKQSEESLRESERRFMDVLYASDDAILLIDDNQFVDCNEATARMLGYPTREEFLQTHPSELSPSRQPDGRSSHEKADEMMRLAFEHGFHRFEWMHRRARGDDFSVEVSLTPIVYRGKRMLHCVWRDISKIKQAEQQYQTLFREMLDGFALHEIVLDAQGQPADYRFLAVNPAFERLTGLNAEALIGKTVLEVMPNTEHHWIETYGRVAMTGEPVHFENYSAELGKHFEVTTFCPAPGQFACMFVDITDRKQTECRTALRNEALAALNGPAMDPEQMRPVLDLIRKHVDAGVAALRLRDEEDFPYLYSIGMTEEFLLEEAMLCKYCSGEAERDSRGRVILSCVCGAVIDGRLPKEAQLTPRGSFVCGDAAKLVEASPPWLTELAPRGTCVKTGFRSLALIPLRSAGEVVGLLQLADSRPNLFGAGEIAFVEELGEAIGVAIARQQAEDLLRVSEERYRLLVNDSPVAIVVQTQDGIQYANPAALGLLHIDSPVDLIGRSVTELMHPDERGMVSALVQRALVERRPVSLVTNRLQLRDGTLVYVESQAIPMVFGGRPAMQIMSTDITGRRQAETALLVSEERFRRIFESSPMGVVLARLIDERYVRVNQRFCQITGYSREELEKMSVSQLTHPDDRALDTRRSQVLQRGEAQIHTYEKRYLRKDGSTVWVRITVSIMRDERGEPTLYLALVEDISERLLLEDQLHKAQKMESLGQLAGGVAHDFNNQLAVIMGFSQIIEAKTPDPEVKTDARQVLKAAVRSADLTRQLLAFARRGEFEAKPVDLRMIVNDTIAVLQRTISKKIEVSSSFEEGPSLVMGDVSLLGNALFNLAINARDAMPDGGALRFIAERVLLSAGQLSELGGDSLPAGVYLRLQVQDTGQGMSKDIMVRIFEPFFTTKAEGKGTGLGLAAVYGTVKRHHGAITVESDAGSGTRFIIHLPLAVAEDDAPLEATAPLPDLNGLRILVVDDEESVLMMLREMLEVAGCRVRICNDGSSAADYFGQNAAEVDLVVLDMNMPRMGGLETLQALRRVDAEVKVLIVTGFAGEGELRAVRELGVSGVVLKPFLQEQMLRVIGQVTNRT